MKKDKMLIYLMVLISIILCIPTITYLFNNRTVHEFDAYYTYTLVKSDNEFVRIGSGIIVIGLLLVFSILYILIIKKEDKIFKNVKQILIFIILISFVFMIILPYLSSDIYYYIGDSWLAAKYKQNPYYTTVEELQDTGINDEILSNTGYWKNTTSVYGPLWNSIAKLLVSFSFGNVTIALFVFKLASYSIHILNSCLVHKITKSKKYMLLYALNPLILIEFLSNVHNDIYLVLFILLSLYFLVRVKNIYFTIIFLALSVSIKYSTVLLVPFILIYCFKNKTISKRILYCFISGVSIIILVILMYLPYYRDYTIFTNMLVQGSKYSQSLLLLLMEIENQTIFKIVNQLAIPIFLIVYVNILVFYIFKRKLTLKELMRSYNFIMIIFIFVVLTNFQKWYILWVFPTIMWETKNMRKFINYLTITAIIPSMGYFIVQGDPFLVGMGYSTKILFFSTLLLITDLISKKIIKIKNNKEKKCHV